MGNVDAAGSTGTRPRFDWMGADREGRGLAEGDDAGASPPSVPAYGLTTQELARYQEAFTGYARSRLLGVGHDQYSERDHQKFEGMSPFELAVGLREELADIVNYAVMIDIQLTRIAKGWKAAVNANA